ncbi:MAG TPA: hypothetical protein VM347_11980 [Nonomuraea sp.]|nr:hypothetical protein [Nonomuraea sp.]
MKRIRIMLLGGTAAMTIAAMGIAGATSGATTTDLSRAATTAQVMSQLHALQQRAAQAGDTQALLALQKAELALQSRQAADSPDRAKPSGPPPPCPSKAPNAGGKQPCGKAKGHHKPTATPSSTGSASATPTATRSATPRPTATATSSVSPRPTTTATATVTPTATATATVTPTATATSSVSPRPTTTATATVTPTATATATVTPTATATSSVSPRPTTSATPAACGPVSAGGSPANGPVSAILYDVGAEISANGGAPIGDAVQEIACVIYENLDL